VCYCIGLVLQHSEFKNFIKSSSTINKKLFEVFKLPNFRREVTSVISQYIEKKAGYPNYVVIFGQDIDLCVKYSKKTLMQISVAKIYNLTLFEVPYIAVNSM
jgi:hypothetical protein